jgi:hypothetical protein
MTTESIAEMTGLTDVERDMLSHFRSMTPTQHDAIGKFLSLADSINQREFAQIVVFYLNPLCRKFLGLEEVAPSKPEAAPKASEKPVQYPLKSSYVGPVGVAAFIVAGLVMHDLIHVDLVDGPGDENWNTALRLVAQCLRLALPDDRVYQTGHSLPYDLRRAVD